MDLLDVITAFLISEVEANGIDMIPPEGCQEGLNAFTIVVRLNKSLYSLKTLRWQNDINTSWLSLEFTPSQADPTRYLCSDGIPMLLYLNDISMLYTKDATKAAIQFKARLSDRLKFTNLSLACEFLSIEIQFEGNGTGTSICLGQKAFLTTILKWFNMQNAHNVSTPMDPDVKLDLAEDQGEKELNDIKGYQEIAGSLMYTALATCSDISFAVAALCQHNSPPFTSHLTAAQRVLHYLKSTADFELHFSTSTGSNDQLTGYTDSDWANDSADHKSAGDHVFLLSNRAVSWQSPRQDVIAMSTLKAGYIICSEGSCESKWLRQLHIEIHGKDASLLPINCENLGALSHITTGIIRALTKHIEVCYLKSWDLHAHKIVDYSYVHMNQNVADILTKALIKNKHKEIHKGDGAMVLEVDLRLHLRLFHFFFGHTDWLVFRWMAILWLR